MIQNGHLTAGGVVLTLVEAMLGALFSAGCFASFWVIAVRPTAGAEAHDA